MVNEVNELPANVNSVLTEFVHATKTAFQNDLRSIVLYGSGAEGKLRPASDVNVIVVLSKFDQGAADQLREPLRLAEAAIKLRPMFLLEEEVQPVVHAFAVKFADVKRRRRVLYGDDPFAEISVSRDDSIFRLKQTLLNLTLRLRESYISRGLREEQLVATIADTAGPCAHAPPRFWNSKEPTLHHLKMPCYRFLLPCRELSNTTMIFNVFQKPD